MTARGASASSAPSMRTSSETTSRSPSCTTVAQRGLGGGVLDDREMAVAERGDLGQVGDAQHLPGLPELAQALADRARGMAADAGVDLVEHERARVARHSPRAPAAASAHDREHHARELPAGGDLAQRAGRHAGVRRDHELDRVAAAGPGSRSLSATSNSASPIASAASCSRTRARQARGRRARAPRSASTCSSQLRPAPAQALARCARARPPRPSSSSRRARARAA